MYVKLLADRCRWMKSYATYILSLQSEGFALNAEDSYDYDKLFSIFLEEAGHLCERDLRTSLAEKPPIYSARSTSPAVGISFLNFAATSPKEALVATRGLPALDFNTALSDSARLRVNLAPGLGLFKTARMVNIITQQRYVLTPDFALKLLILNERRKVHQNVILSGNTGIGKTELMSLFSLVINSDSELLPDILYETADFIYRNIIHDGAQKGNVLRIPKFSQYLKDKSPLNNPKVAFFPHFFVIDFFRKRL